MTVKRLRANQLYRTGQIDEALELYVESMIGLDLTDQKDQRLDQVQKELKYPIMLNIATCLYKKK